jgi:hypothetical protein
MAAVVVAVLGRTGVTGGPGGGRGGEMREGMEFASYKEKAFSEYLSVTRLSGNSKQRPARKSKPMQAVASSRRPRVT